MNPLITPSLTRRLPGVPLKAVAAVLVAACASGLLVGAGTIADRFDAEAAGRLAAVSHVDALASAGPAFLSPGNGTVSFTTIRKLSDALDPIRPRTRENPTRGALYQLMMAMRQLALVAVVPLLLLSVLHAFVTQSERADSRLVGLGLKFFLLMFMMWFYPRWDTMLFQPSMKIAEQLSAGAIYSATMGGVAALSGGTAESMGIMNDDALSLIDANRTSLECYVKDIDESQRDPYFEARCQSRSQFSKLLAQSDAQIVAGGNVSQEPPSRSLSDRFSAWASSTVASIANAVGRTLIGFLFLLQAIAFTVILWLVWLKVVVSRAVSLALAPLALIWVLWPTDNTNAQDWFTGHAKIVMMPIGVSLGMLVFVALQGAVATADLGTNVGGIAIKVVLFITFMMMMLKTSTMTDLAAGKIAKFAGDVGSATLKTTVALGTAVAGGAVAGTAMAGSAAAGSAAAGGIAAKAGTAMSGAAARVGGAMNKYGAGRAVTATMSSLAGNAKAAAATRTVGKVGQVALDATKGTFGVAGKAAKIAWSNRSDGTLAGTMRAGLGTLKDARAEIAQDKERNRSRITRSERDEARTANDTRDERVRSRRERGLSDAPEARKGEKLRLAIEVGETGRSGSARTVDLEAGSSRGVEAILEVPEIKRITDDIRGGHGWNTTEKMALPLAAALSASGAGIGLTDGRGKGGNGATLMLDEKSATSFIEMMEDNNILREGVEAEAQRVYPDGKAPDVMTPDGLNQLIGKSTDFLNAVRIGAQFSLVRDAELERRENVVASAGEGIQGGSVEEIALRELRPDLAEKLAGDAKALRAASEKALRMSVYLNMTTEEREAAGHGPFPNHAALVAVSQDSAIDTSALKSADSFATVSAKQQVALRQALAAVEAHLDDLSSRSVVVQGRQLGLDVSRHVAGEAERYTFQEGSILHSLAEGGSTANSADFAKALQLAADYAEANEQLAMQLAAAEAKGGGEAQRLLAEIALLSPAEIDRRSRA
jgi:hypothetical protein